MRERQSPIRKLVEKSRIVHGLFVFALVLVLMSTGTMLSVQAETVRNVSGSRNSTVSALRDALRSSDTVTTLRPGTATGSARKGRVLLKERLAESNRLALELGVLKKKAQEGADTVRIMLRKVAKNKADLTGDQLVALKDVSTQLQGQKEKIADQNKVVREIRDRLAKLRSSERYADAASAVAELVTAQKAMIATLRESIASVAHLADILGNN